MPLSAKTGVYLVAASVGLMFLVNSMQRATVINNKISINHDLVDSLLAEEGSDAFVEVGGSEGSNKITSKTKNTLKKASVPDAPQVAAEGEAHAEGSKAGATEPLLHMDGTANGYWVWDPKGAYINDILIVYGGLGSGTDPTPAFAEMGFKVWKPSLACGDSAECNEYGQKESIKRGENSSMKKALGAYFAFMKYLSDDNRVASPVTVFLSSKATKEEILVAAARAQQANRYVSIEPTGVAHEDMVLTTLLPQSEPNVEYRNLYAQAFGTLPAGTKSFAFYKAANGFAVPAKVLKKLNLAPPFFKKALTVPIRRKGTTGLDMGFFKATLHVVFGEHPVLESAPPTRKPFRRVGAVQPDTTTMRYSYNEKGTWAWDTKATANNDTLVVIGGTSVDPTLELVRRGFMCWIARPSCKAYYMNMWQDKHMTNRHKMEVCTETWGYFSYLADDLPSKPLRKFTAFAHGHFEAWHQPGDMGTLVADAVNCAKKTNEYTPLTKYDINKFWVAGWEDEGKVAEWIGLYNKVFGPRSRMIKGSRLTSWAAASFVLPADVRDSHDADFYKHVLQAKGEHGRSGLDGFFFEYTLAFMFGKPEIISPEELRIPQCPDFNYAENDAKYIRHKKAKVIGMTNALKEQGRLEKLVDDYTSSGQ